jgi:integrase
VAIRPLDVQAIYQEMTDRGLSPRTVQGAHWVLNAAFRQALQWEMILEVPTKGVKLPRIRTREMRVFSVEEAKILLKFAQPTMYGTLFSVAVTTGMRPASTSGSSGRTLTGSAELSA